MKKALILLAFHAMAAQAQVDHGCQLLDAMGEEAAKSYMSFRPSTALFYRLPANPAGEGDSNAMEDYDPGVESRLRADMANLAAKVQHATGDSLNSLCAAQLQALNIQLDIFSGFSENEYGYIDTWYGHVPFIINQINGPLIDLPEALTNTFAISNINDAQRYIARLQKFGPMIDSVNEKFVYDINHGWYPPPSVLARSLALFKNYTSGSVTTHPLYLSLSAQLARLNEVDEATKSALLTQAASALSTTVYPGYSRTVAMLERFSASRRPAVTSVVDLPGGRTYYKRALKFQTDSTDGASTLHEFGLAEVLRLQSLLVHSGADQSNETTEQYLKRTSHLPAEDFNLEQAILDRLSLLNDRANARRDWLVVDSPAAELRFRAFPKALEASAPLGKYTAAGASGSAIYWVNVSKLARMSYSFLEVVTFHETVPGHHLQFSIAQRKAELPVLLKFSLFNAYIEGWATYAEGLASEAGLYSDAKKGEASRLNAELLRSVRVVIDTGIHAEGWSRSQAIDYFIATLNNDHDSASAEVDRYLAMPGQAAGYQVGLSLIRKKRLANEQSLGSSFDLKKFNTDLLKNGAMPLYLMH